MSLLPNLDNPKTNRRFLLAISIGAVLWIGGCMKACIQWTDVTQTNKGVVEP